MKTAIHDGTITRTDRIALSNALYALAERFAERSKLWPSTSTMRPDMQRKARMLSEVARATLSPIYEYDRADAFYDAGCKVLDREIAAYEFFRSVNAHPTGGKR